jgi:hypothetical protein
VAGAATLNVQQPGYLRRTMAIALADLLLALDSERDRC